MSFISALTRLRIARDLYLAITGHTFETVFTTELGQLFWENHFVRLLVFDEHAEVITRWIPA